MVNPPTNPDPNPTGVDELSNLLLQGWTMLADVCPRVGCHMPLMRSRQGRVVCCTCRADIVMEAPTATGDGEARVPNGTLEHEGNGGTTDDQPMQTRQEDTAATTTATTADAVATATTIAAGVNASGEDPAAATANGKKATGNAMETDAHASTSNGAQQTVPAVTNPQHAPTSTPTPTAITPAPPPTATTAERAIVPASATTTEQRVREAAREAMSLALGDKLLSGWTLLSEGCANCIMPLLRSRDGRVRCFGCTSSMSGGPSNSAAAAAAAAAAAESLANTRGLPAPAVDGRGTGTSTAMVGQSAQQQEHGVARTGRVSNRVATAAGGDGSGGGGAVTDGNVQFAATGGDVLGGGGGVGGGGTDEDVEAELVASERAAAETLRALRMRLQNGGDARSQLAICSAMTEAANTIAACRRARQARLPLV